MGRVQASVATKETGKNSWRAAVPFRSAGWNTACLKSRMPVEEGVERFEKKEENYQALIEFTKCLIAWCLIA